MDNIKYTVKNTVNGEKRSEKEYEIPDKVSDVKRLIAEIQRDDALILRDVPRQALEASGRDHENKVWGHHEEKVTNHARKINDLFDRYTDLKSAPEKLDDDGKQVLTELEKMLIKEGVL
ncbi:hypothetical protein A3H16_02040 [Candidatus Kaiserbacteria bacterium RIFCSPLOWO2_12_FULL_53_8]|uniref:Uncharacterized protein n=2 Tax=Candidatus Kaiseribacteriota TaxID=1752734 RepID=A0A1F6CYG7_9BACT|nr:MAG: hypothetical protein A2851_00930 [Candidatus Kaiserbacteria bacterium RIFCSPHIGHO2_01_FULL_53_29]OGG92373.1 MAG: hypothetical protein A3H16_02040 [Candidatus Kaiserbacteria bacterium RIFCSPLOWO2_12_FULL_53_8]